MKKERNLSILSNKDWAMIERWLSYSNDEKKLFCPFHSDHSKCEMLFPGTIYDDEPIDYQCPCYRLSLEEVIEVAKEILAEMKTAQE